MVQIKCECNELHEIEINTWNLFQEIKLYFEEKKLQGVYEDITIKNPYYIGHSDISGEHKWYADKWYKCNNCNIIWEIIYPDFPAKGKVRKLDCYGNLVRDSIFRLENRKNKI
jgi:acetone carboxylase gamma subunit